MIHLAFYRCKSNKIMFITLYFFMIFFQQVKNDPNRIPKAMGTQLKPDL